MDVGRQDQAETDHHRHHGRTAIGQQRHGHAHDRRQPHHHGPVDQDEDGNITRLYATYDPKSRGGWSEDGRKVRGTIHWVSAKHAKPIKVKLYDHLFTIPDFNDLEEGESHLDYLNPDSLIINTKALAEPSLLEAKPGDCFQFLRLGYFVADDHHTKEAPVFNRVVELRDSWAKKSKK